MVPRADIAHREEGYKRDGSDRDVHRSSSEEARDEDDDHHDQDDSDEDVSPVNVPSVVGVIGGRLVHGDLEGRGVDLSVVLGGDGHGVGARLVRSP